MHENELQKLFHQRVRSGYEEAMRLYFPMFPITVGGKTIKQPKLMQRVMVAKILKHRTFGNWSQPGTGKTLAAVLVAYAINAKVTVICCPRDTIQDEWTNHIKGVFPNAEVVAVGSKFKNIKFGKETFLIFNYEKFQQTWSKKEVKALSECCKIDLLVFDEIHKAKQRDPKKESERRKTLIYMRKLFGKKNPYLHVIGQTGTPSINDTLREPISHLELITGKKFDDLPTKISLQNVIRVRQAMITHGIRCPSDYDQKTTPKITEIDCSKRVGDLTKARHRLLSLDQILLEEKTPFILRNLNHKSKTVIYLHFVQDLVEPLRKVVEKAGYKVDIFTGDVTSSSERTEIKNEFINGKTEVLIASEPIGTGVDGLQHVCNKMIIPILPWTAAGYDQLTARLERPGQKQQVEVIIPLAFVNINGYRWSLDKVRWDRILYKQSISDVLVDGVLPESGLSLAKVKAACLQWWERVSSGEIYEYERPEIDVDFAIEEKRRNNNFSDLTKMHIQLNKMHSSKAAELLGDEKYHGRYHQGYNKAIKTWEVKPREVLASWCQKGEVVGDFGCGDDAHIAKLLPNNKVYSFDHFDRNKNITRCDIAHVPLKDACLDVAIYSLSLMGSNYKEYFVEAHRCLRPGGKLYIAELTSHGLVETLKSDLQEIGFRVLDKTHQSKFTFVKAVKV